MESAPTFTLIYLAIYLNTTKERKKRTASFMGVKE